MSFEWREYYGIAEEMMGQTCSIPVSNEARMRAAISRAYYAAYCSANEWLQANTPHGAPQPSAAFGSHDRIINRFLDQSESQYASIGENLRRAKLLRQDADYRKARRPRLTDVSLAMGYALSVIKAITLLDGSRFDFYV